MTDKEPTEEALKEARNFAVQSLKTAMEALQFHFKKTKSKPRKQALSASAQYIKALHQSITSEESNEDR